YTTLCCAYTRVSAVSQSTDHVTSMRSAERRSDIGGRSEGFGSSLLTRPRLALPRARCLGRRRWSLRAPSGRYRARHVAARALPSKMSRAWLKCTLPANGGSAPRERPHAFVACSNEDRVSERPRRARSSRRRPGLHARVAATPKRGDRDPQRTGKGAARGSQAGFRRMEVAALGAWR